MSKSQTPRISKSKSAIMTKVLVMENGAMIGSGFIIEYPDGGFFVPALIDFKGDEIAPGAYELTRTNDSFPVVVPMGVQ